MKIQIINGPNINMLGTREPDLYGLLSLAELIELTEDSVAKLGVELSWYQSNHEGQIVDYIQSIVVTPCDGLVINPAGFSHTSIAILDALKLLSNPIAEVHLTQVHQREEFRKNLVTAQAADFVITGLGKNSYIAAIKAMIDFKTEGK